MKVRGWEPLFIKGRTHPPPCIIVIGWGICLVVPLNKTPKQSQSQSLFTRLILAHTVYTRYYMSPPTHLALFHPLGMLQCLAASHSDHRSPSRASCPAKQRCAIRPEWCGWYSWFVLGMEGVGREGWEGDENGQEAG